MTTEPNWGTTPPTEPGWYWFRDRHHPAHVVRVVEKRGKLFTWNNGSLWTMAAYADELWWPVRIEEPPR